jgi:murein DD-endopeptidase MepM/ murein hydrolase activator NlpD
MSDSRHRQRLIAAIVIVLSQVSTATAASNCWRAPVDAPISDPYREPACRWCPGNRGIEYDTPPGVAVIAVASGRVTFVGSIAGTGYMVVRHANGVRTTYGNISNGRFRRGDLVIRGVQVGSTAGRFHFGVRDVVGYVDPAPMIGQLVYAPRLIPNDGAPAAPARPPKLRCGGDVRRPVPSQNVSLRIQS